MAKDAAEHPADHDEHGPHVVSVQLLVGVFAALLVLTVLTVLVAKVDMGAMNTFVALGVATVKAGLVALYFMHLRWDQPFNAIILLTSIFLLILFLALATLDSTQNQPTFDYGFTERRMEQDRERLGITYGDGAAEQGRSAADDPKVAALAQRAASLFGVLPAEAASRRNPITPEKVALGQMLWFEERLSHAQEISCNTCHPLDRFGADGEPTSPGHLGQRGRRNSPTVFNAALQTSQFWDGRAANVEDQAVMPVLDQVEMAMPDEPAIVAILRSMPGYVERFEAAFPEAEEPVTIEHFKQALGAFERRLITPDSSFDRFMGGEHGALSADERRGLELFISVGCTTCHAGPLLGGNMFQKMGLLKPYPSEDEGRYEVTDNMGDKGFFKVPQLRNVAETGPYLHDGSIATLEEVTRIMADHQLAKELTDAEVAALVAFMKSLTGVPPADLIARPELPVSGPDTPGPGRD